MKRGKSGRKMKGVVRTSISLPEIVLKFGLRKTEEEEHNSFSAYLEHLLRERMAQESKSYYVMNEGAQPAAINPDVLADSGDKVVQAIKRHAAPPPPHRGASPARAKGRRAAPTAPPAEGSAES